MKYEVAQIGTDYFVVERNESNILRQYASCGGMAQRARAIADALNKGE